MKNQLKAGVVLSYVALLVNSIISLIYTPIMLKILGQSEYGIYSLATSMTAYVSILNFGLGNAVIRYTAKYRATKEKEECCNLYGTFCLMYGVLGITALAIGVMLTFNTDRIFSNSLSVDEINKLTILMAVMVINISIGIGSGFFSAVILAYEKFIFQKVVNIIGSIINPIVMLPILMMGYGSIALTLITTIINFITIFINVYYCFKVLKIRIKFCKLEKNLFREIIIFSFFIFLNLVIDKVYWSTDQIILGIFSGAATISIYTVGTSFMGYFSGFSVAISNVFLSRVTRIVTKENSEKEVSDLFIRVGRLQYIILSFTVSGFIIFGQEFINLWVGKDYSDAFVIAGVMLVPMMLSLVQSMGGIILQAKNEQKFKSIIYALTAVFNVFISVIFVQWWGPIGCAIGTAIAFTIGNVIIMNIYYWKKINIDIPLFWKNIFSMSFAVFVSVVFVNKLNTLIPAENWSVLFMKIIIFSFFYITLMWFLGMNKYERNILIFPVKNVLHKINNKGLYKTRQ